MCCPDSSGWLRLLPAWLVDGATRCVLGRLTAGRRKAAAAPLLVFLSAAAGACKWGHTQQISSAKSRQNRCGSSHATSSRHHVLELVKFGAFVVQRSPTCLSLITLQ